MQTISVLLPLGVVHKLCLQEEGGRWSKKLTFCKLLYHRKCKRRGVGGQKKPNFVNIVCERGVSKLEVCIRHEFHKKIHKVLQNIKKKFNSLLHK